MKQLKIEYKAISLLDKQERIEKAYRLLFNEIVRKGIPDKSVKEILKST